MQQQKKAEKTRPHSTGILINIKGCLIISGLNYKFNQIKNGKSKKHQTCKKCINPESCKKLALILTCYHCASTRVKHLAEIQDYSQTSNYTGIKKCLICSSLECRLELHNWNTRCGQWGTKVPVSLTDLFSIHSPLQTIRFPTVNNHVLLVYISKKNFNKKEMCP